LLEGAGEGWANEEQGEWVAFIVVRVSTKLGIVPQGTFSEKMETLSLWIWGSQKEWLSMLTKIFGDIWFIITLKSGFSEEARSIFEIGSGDEGNSDGKVVINGTQSDSGVVGTWSKYGIE